MNTDKAKRLLKKVQALFDNLSDQGAISALERDLLLSYLRDLYDAVQHTDEVSGIKKDLEQDTFHMEPPVVKSKEVPVPIEKKEEPVFTLPERKPDQTEKAYEPIHTLHEDTKPSPTPPPPVREEPIRMSEPIGVSDPVYQVAEEIDPVLIALFEFKEVGELGEKLKLQPIDRIEHGMGINERIFTINELFNGDNELFKKTMEHLNGLQTFSAAREHLISDVATRFKWADPAKKNKATYFLQLVRRKYVSR